MKNAFHFILKAPFVLKIIKKRFDKKDQVNFKIYGVTTLLTNNHSTLITVSHAIKANR